MLNDYIGILLFAAVALVAAGGLVALSALVGPKKADEGKLAPFECGLWPERNASRAPFRIHFYVVAMMFMLFALEAAFLLPWAVVLRVELGLYGLVEMGVFLVILIVGYLYVWKRGAFDWRMAEESGSGE